jgi:hypothetical protein
MGKKLNSKLKDIEFALSAMELEELMQVQFKSVMAAKAKE